MSSEEFPVTVWATDEDVEFNAALRERVDRALRAALDED